MPPTDPNQPAKGPDPRRPPDWRFRAGRRTVADGRVLLPWQADEMTWRLAEFLGSEKACRTDAERERLALRCPGLASVLKLARGSDRRCVAAIEGFLFTGESAKRIAPTVGVDARTLTVYEIFFFDVVDRLNASEFIMNVIADKLRRREFETATEVHGIAQLIGYLCGGEVLRDYMACEPRDPVKPWRTPTELLVTLWTRLQLQIACRLTAECGSLDGRDGNEILEILNGIIDQRTMQGEPSYSRHSIEKQTRAVMSGFSGSEKPR